jgi:hypothetical protein
MPPSSSLLLTRPPAARAQASVKPATVAELHRPAPMEALGELLSSLGMALFTAAQDCPTVPANLAAERLLREGDVLRLAGGRLAAVDTEQTQRLSVFLNHEPSQAAPARLVLIGKGGRLVTLRELPTPLPADARACTTQRAWVAQAPWLLSASVDERAQAAQQAYGWSSREAELAGHLLRGRCLHAAALVMGNTEDHARQRLKAVFAKAGVGSQSQLISVLSDIA